MCPKAASTASRHINVASPFSRSQTASGLSTRLKAGAERTSSIAPVWEGWHRLDDEKLQSLPLEYREAADRDQQTCNAQAQRHPCSTAESETDAIDCAPTGVTRPHAGLGLSGRFCASRSTPLRRMANQSGFAILSVYYDYALHSGAAFKAVVASAVDLNDVLPTMTIVLPSGLTWTTVQALSLGLCAIKYSVAAKAGDTPMATTTKVAKIFFNIPSFPSILVKSSGVHVLFEPIEWPALPAEQRANSMFGALRYPDDGLTFL